MIEEKIIVEYVMDSETKNVAIEAEDLYEGKEWEDWGDYAEKSREFNIFEDDGKVSETDMSPYECVNREAERLLAERIKIKGETREDQARAVELADIVYEAYYKEKRTDRESFWWNIVEKGDFSDKYTPGWVTIKITTSKSKWYETEYGDGHARSCYYYQVPESVEKEARELRKIREKHKYNELFDFGATNCPVRTVRVADHRKMGY